MDDEQSTVNNGDLQLLEKCGGAHVGKPIVPYR